MFGMLNGAFGAGVLEGSRDEMQRLAEEQYRLYLRVDRAAWLNSVQRDSLATSCEGCGAHGRGTCDYCGRPR